MLQLVRRRLLSRSLMELKIVYRILRQVSDWTLTGFYSDVHVEGSENVPKHGPIILLVAST